MRFGLSENFIFNDFWDSIEGFCLDRELIDFNINREVYNGLNDINISIQGLLNDLVYEHMELK